MNQTVLITGASSGIGRATAEHFHAQGWNVIATMRVPVAEGVWGERGRMLVTRLDVQDEASIYAAVQAGLAKFGAVDVLVNNAGYGAYGPLEATSMDKIRRQFDVNVIGLLATTKAVLPHFRQQRRGVIVNISSIGGRLAFPLGTLYHGSKFAVEGLSEALQYELAPLGIRVKVVEPGFVRTDFAGRSFDLSTDPALTEYHPVVQALYTAMGTMTEQASPPDVVAQAIYDASVDGTERLRYAAGADADQLLGARRAEDDAEFFAGIRAQFGLGG
jgi:NAD(P)-dependent dehydrogenase (short-subunit alcohol dehydrogenase family)